MSSRHQPLMGADSPDASVTYRVPLRSLDSDHTTSLNLRVYGKRDLENHLAQIRADWPTYDVGTPRQVSE